ncbi:MAG: hypothetical protein Q7T61_08610 [Caulobacter sp.]|nr:hypothetical protein [Caulobacter sp.]
MTASFNPWHWVTGSARARLANVAPEPVAAPLSPRYFPVCTPEEFASHREACLNPRR